jgi:hypothetical protein
MDHLLKTKEREDLDDLLLLLRSAVSNANALRLSATAGDAANAATALRNLRLQAAQAAATAARFAPSLDANDD